MSVHLQGRLSPNFTLREMIRSDVASRVGVDNTPTEEHYENLKSLCLNCLEPIRTLVGLPIHVSSGYRCFAINTLIGGSKFSQHTTGEAADIECRGVDNLDLGKLIAGSSIQFDQLILEFYRAEEGPSSGWIHVSHKAFGLNRREVLTANRWMGKVVYSKGLP